jgi:predicted nucleic acid-binding protein
VKLLFDTSVWVDHLRHDALAGLLPRLRGRYQLAMDALVAAELLAGCRSRVERRVVEGLIAPFRTAGRLVTAKADDLGDAGRALSRLREGGATLRNPGSALLDAAIAVGTVRLGALLVSQNEADFRKLATVLPLRFETLAELEGRLAG